jgi:hypothetical protein
MLHQLAKKQDAAYGDLVVVITSFQRYYDGDATIAPHSIMYPSIQQEESCTNIRAIPLTIEILRGAISFVDGNEEPAEFSTVEDGLREYFKKLGSLLGSSTTELLTSFIQNRNWTSNVDVPCHGADLIHVRRFLHMNLARQTGIVAHTVDGIHRVTAFDCALLGLGTSTTVGEPDHHPLLGNRKITVIVFTPTAITEKFAEIMKGKSNEIQRSLTQNLPHSLRDFLHEEMNNVKNICATKEMPYLWDCLGALYKRLAGWDIEDQNILEQWIHKDCNLFGPQSEYSTSMNAASLHSIDGPAFTTITLRYIQTWVKHTADYILKVLGESKHEVFDKTIVPRDDARLAAVK